VPHAGCDGPNLIIGVILVITNQKPAATGRGIFEQEMEGGEIPSVFIPSRHFAKPK
jgi:hypothetical protein